MNKLFVFLILSVFGFFSCLKEKTPTPTDCGFVVSYTNDIRPIIENSCKTQTGPGTGCHDAWIDNYSSITVTVEDGRWANEVITLKTMPQFPESIAWGIDSLTAEEIQLMSCWIEQGYPEN